MHNSSTSKVGSAAWSSQLLSTAVYGNRSLSSYHLARVIIQTTGALSTIVAYEIK